MIERLSGPSGVVELGDSETVELGAWTITLERGHMQLSSWSGTFELIEPNGHEIAGETVTLVLTDDGLMNAWTGKAIITRATFGSMRVEFQGTGPLSRSEAE